jgi:hypothetical protein
VDLSVQVLVGKPGKVCGYTSNLEEICALVDKRKPELLVLGSAGKTHLKGFMVGSVSSYCVGMFGVLNTQQTRTVL